MGDTPIYSYFHYWRQICGQWTAWRETAFSDFRYRLSLLFDPRWSELQVNLREEGQAMSKFLDFSNVSDTLLWLIPEYGTARTAASQSKTSTLDVCVSKLSSGFKFKKRTDPGVIRGISDFSNLSGTQI